jgi:hypothetical protein
VRDPLLIDEGEKIVPDEWRSTYRREHRQSFLTKFKKRTPDELSDDLIAAFDKFAETFDRISDLQKEKNLLLSETIETKRKLKLAKWQIWIMGLVVSPIVSEFVKKLLHWIFANA